MKHGLTGVLVTVATVMALTWPTPTHAALVNINTADSEELQTLDGIGEVKAQAIIDYRATNGQFTNKEDIMNVSGIGQATYDKIKNSITVGTVENDDSYSDDTSNSSTTSSASTGAAKEPRIPVGGLIITAPSIGYVNQAVQFEVEPEEGTNDRLVRYRWNFGDATTAEIKSSEHSYAYPGAYVVMVKSHYDKKELTARHEINILSARLSLMREFSGDVTVKNENSHEIDLGGMKLVGKSVFEFPEYTILMPGKSLTIPHEKIDEKGSAIVTLHDEFGNVVASTYRPIPAATVSANIFSAAPAATRTNKVSIIDDTEIATTSVGNAVEANTDVAVNDNYNSQSASALQSFAGRLPEGSLPYLGLIGIISLGLVALYGSKLT